MNREISLRPSVDEDRDFLFRLYASTRADEMSLAPWSAEQKNHFLQMQFSLQDTQYRQHYPSARFDIVLLEGQPVGRFYVNKSDAEIRIVDISLFPECRGRGIGGQLITELFAQATDEKKAVRIHVMQNNPAMKLYLRLGFRKSGQQGLYDLMEWIPT